MNKEAEILNNIKTVFSVYLAVFPTPRSDTDAETQEIVKKSVRTVRDNLLELLDTSKK